MSRVLGAEICICAAIVTTNGRIIRGHRHDDAMFTAWRKKLTPSSLSQTQGFITSDNRFVDRGLGMRLQRAARMTRPDGSELLGDLLFSEDLY